MTTESFLVACKKAGLSVSEMDMMTIGMCLDYAYEYNGLTEDEKPKEAVRKATQKDFDSF